MATSKQSTILLVDDDPLLLRALERLFRCDGYLVHSAAGGLEALAIMAVFGNEVDLVVTDVDMPRLHGPGLAAQLGSGWPRLPIVFVSGRHRNAIDTEPPLPPDAAFLKKPFSHRELTRVVQRALGDSELCAARSRSKKNS